MKEIRGGYLADIPQPHVRRWPSAPERRTVRVMVAQYTGIGKHWFVSLKEEDNPIWDAREDGWRVAWDDAEARGRYFDGPKSLSYGWAHTWAKQMLAKHFPAHEICGDFDKPVRWFYREGD